MTTDDRESGMRLDIYLSRTRLIMPRTAAKRACDNGIVFVNDRVAKPGLDVHMNDLIAIRFTDQDLTVAIRKMPGKSVPKQTADIHYEVVQDTHYNR